MGRGCGGQRGEAGSCQRTQGNTGGSWLAGQRQGKATSAAAWWLLWGRGPGRAHAVFSSTCISYCNLSAIRPDPAPCVPPGTPAQRVGQGGGWAGREAASCSVRCGMRLDAGCGAAAHHTTNQVAAAQPAQHDSTTYRYNNVHTLLRVAQLSPQPPRHHHHVHATLN